MIEDKKNPYEEDIKILTIIKILYLAHVLKRVELLVTIDKRKDILHATIMYQNCFTLYQHLH